MRFIYLVLLLSPVVYMYIHMNGTPHGHIPDWDHGHIPIMIFDCQYRYFSVTRNVIITRSRFYISYPWDGKIPWYVRTGCSGPIR